MTDEESEYRKKPIVIRARMTEVEEIIHTLEGDMTARPGDWIVTGVKGERYPVKPDIFEATYEPITTNRLVSKESEAMQRLKGETKEVLIPIMLVYRNRKPWGFTRAEASILSDAIRRRDDAIAALEACVKELEHWQREVRAGFGITDADVEKAKLTERERKSP